MRRALLVVALCGGMVSAASAEVLVRIADLPTTVLRYSPVFVTAAIQNTGAEAILVPVSGLSDSRYVVELGRTEESLTEVAPFDSSGGGQAVLLPPGGIWYFRVDIGARVQDLGAYVIQVGLTSTGECQFRPNATERGQVRAIDPNPFHETYACWAGRVLSPVAVFVVVDPTGPTDAAALEYVRSSEFPVSCCLNDRFNLRLQFGSAALLQRFPASHYTYVAGLYAGAHDPEALAKLERLQPTNVLTPYLRIARSLALAEQGRTDEAVSSAAAIPDRLRPFVEQVLRRTVPASPPAEIKR